MRFVAIVNARRFEHFTDEELEARERRSRSAIEGELRCLDELAQERAIRRSAKIEIGSAAPQGAAGPQ